MTSADTVMLMCEQTVLERCFARLIEYQARFFVVRWGCSLTTQVNHAELICSTVICDLRPRTKTTLKVKPRLGLIASAPVRNSSLD